MASSAEIQGCGYVVVPDVEDDVQSEDSTHDRTCTKKAYGGNVFDVCRRFLAIEMLPNVGQLSPLVSPHATLLQKNTELYNPFAADDLTRGHRRRSSFFWKVQPGSTFTAVLTFVSSALGPGMLALPSAFARVGFAGGVASLIAAACLSCVSLSIVMVASRYTEAKSYAELLALASGSTRSGLVLDTLMVVYGLYSILALLMFEGDFVPAILDALGVPNPGRTKCILFVAACAWPLVMPPRINALRYVASLSPVAVLFVAGNVVFNAPIYYAAHAEDDKPVLWRFEPTQFVQASSIFVCSLMCHANAVPVVNILDRPSVERIVKVTTCYHTCVLALYLLLGAGGYLSFATAVRGDFLLNYPIDDLAFVCCRVLLAIVAFLGIPMNTPYCAPALQRLISAIRLPFAEPLVEERQVLRAILASLILAAAAISAQFFTDVGMLVCLVGGTLTSAQMFWLPAYVYWKILYPTQPNIFRKLVMGLMITGGVLGISNLACSMLA